ncbi:MAG TPA: hypothetical protein VKG20_08660, partial [Methylomirabilota bacterium]|nr:hypothetical protein [Methylomirabilota bacterium]
IFQRLRLEADGYVLGARVREMYERLRRGDPSGLGQIWMILAAELWYRTMFPESRTGQTQEERP